MLNLNSRRFKIIRKNHLCKIEKDFHRDFILSGWVNQIDLKKYFNKLEDLTYNFEYLRTIDIFNNFIKIVLVFVSLILVLFYINNNRNIAKSGFYIEIVVLIVLFVLKEIHKKYNFSDFIRDMNIGLTTVNNEFFKNKGLELIFDYYKQELIIINEGDKSNEITKIKEKFDEFVIMCKPTSSDNNKKED